MENALILKFDGNRQLIIEINTFSNYQKEFESIYKFYLYNIKNS